MGRKRSLRSGRKEGSGREKVKTQLGGCLGRREDQLEGWSFSQRKGF